MMLDQQIRFQQGQADHGAVAPLDTADEFASNTLNAVGPGLVTGLTGLPVGLDFGLVQLAKCHVGGDQSHVTTILAGQRHRRHHLMHLAGERLQHVFGIEQIGRFLQHSVAQHHYGVGAQHRQCVRRDGHTGHRLVAGETADIILRLFALFPLLGHIEFQHLETVAKLGQQFATTGRTRRKIELQFVVFAHIYLILKRRRTLRNTRNTQGHISIVVNVDQK